MKLCLGRLFSNFYVVHGCDFPFCFLVWFSSVVRLAVRRKGNVFLLNVFVFGLFSICMSVTFFICFDLNILFIFSFVYVCGL